MAKSLAAAPNNNIFAVGALASETVSLTNADDLVATPEPAGLTLRSPRRSKAGVRAGVAVRTGVHSTAWT